MARTQKWYLGKGTDQEVVVYGRVENWNFFHETAVTDDLYGCKVATTKSTKDVKQHNRKRFPGDDNPITVKSHPRIVLSGAEYTTGNALPGKTVIYATDPETWDGGDEQRAFQYVGDFKHLYLYSQSDASKDLFIWNQSGTRYHVCEETGDDSVQAGAATDRIR